MDDAIIIEMYFSRDENAITETSRKYGKLCFDISMKILHITEDAEECVNDTYTAVWYKIPPTRPDSLMAFICKITRNLSLKRLEYLRAKKRYGETISLSEFEDSLRGSSPPFEEGDQEIVKQIDLFLRKQRPIVRNVFIRKYWFFDSISDIAQRYSFSETKVKSMLFHTRIKLKEHLLKEGIEI